MSERSYRIAVIPGDGNRQKVAPEGVRVLEAAAKQYGFELSRTGSCSATDGMAGARLIDVRSRHWQVNGAGAGTGVGGG